MNERLEQIFERPLSHKMGMVGGTLALISALFWFCFYSPVNEEVGRVTDLISGSNGLQVQITQQQGLRKNLQKFILEVQVLDEELRKALSELPDKKEIDQLLARISDRARDAGLDIKLFKPKPEERKDFYAAVPVDIEVAGTYHQVATFFDEVGHLERIVNLTGLSMSEPQANEDSVTLKTSVVATAFRFLDESERPKENLNQSAEGKKRGKKK